MQPANTGPLRQSMQGIVTAGKKLGKTVYLFSVESESGKVVHINAVSEKLKSKGLDARAWATKVAEIVGGKVGYVVLSGERTPTDTPSEFLQAGGKEDGAQGAGNDPQRVNEAIEAAKSYLSQY